MAVNPIPMASARCVSRGVWSGSVRWAALDPVAIATIVSARTPDRSGVPQAEVLAFRGCPGGQSRQAPIYTTPSLFAFEFKRDC